MHYAATNGYNRVEQVIEPGEYAVRGDIIDIFPVGTADPLRIDLFDDEIERIRTFDAMSQRTTGERRSYTFKVMSEVLLDANTIRSFRTKYREAFGAAFNEDEIYEAVSNGQKYIGMENWLPFSMMTRCRRCLTIFRELRLSSEKRRRSGCGQGREHCRLLPGASGGVKRQKRCRN